MNYSVKFMLSLIGSIISGESLPNEENAVDWEEIFDISNRHSVANIIGHAVSSGKYMVSGDYISTFSKKMFEAVAVDENQRVEFNKIFRAFDENEIDYMPLKGLNIKNLYSSPDMRNMSDGDILIRVEQFEKFDIIMKELGYSFKVESNHEFVYFKPPFINIELHKYLIPTYNDDLYSYYGDGWKLANKNENSFRYSLSPDDEFIYIFTHFAKHYRDGGAGIKYIADMWLYLRKNNIDKEKVFFEFKKLGLDVFARHIFKLMSVWFENENSDELTDDITDFMLSGGQYGDGKKALIASELRENSNMETDDILKTSFIRLIFPSMAHMKNSYPFLKKCPYLLPLFWIYRIIRSIFYGKNSAKMYKIKSEYITDENLKSYSTHMKTVGLDIYNGRKD